MTPERQCLGRWTYVDANTRLFCLIVIISMMTLPKTLSGNTNMVKAFLSLLCLAGASILTISGEADAAPVTTSSSHSMVVRRMVTDTISVPGMQCESCEQRISKNLKGVKGVSKVIANADQKKVIVTYRPDQIDRTSLEQRIADIGYDAGSATATDAVKNALPMCCRAK